MFILQLDRVGHNRIAGFTLRTPDGAELFKTMEEVLERCQGVAPEEMAWSSLNCAMNWLIIAQPWGEFETSRTVRFWDWAAGEVKTQEVRRSPGF